MNTTDLPAGRTGSISTQPGSPTGGTAVQVVRRSFHPHPAFSEAAELLGIAAQAPSTTARTERMLPSLLCMSSPDFDELLSVWEKVQDKVRATRKAIARARGSAAA